MDRETIIILSEMIFLFIGLVCYRIMWERREANVVLSFRTALLLTAPAPVFWQSILLGKGCFKVGGLVLLLLIVGASYGLTVRRTFRLETKWAKEILLSYLCFMVSLSGVLLYIICFQNAGQKADTCVIVFGFVLAVSLFSLVKQLWNVSKKQRATCEDVWEERISAEDRTEEQIDISKHPFGKKKVFFAVFVLTVIYGILVFAGLGSRSTPETALSLSLGAKGDNEIILDMGKQTKIETLYIYLGHMIDRIVSVSYYDEEKEEWVVLNDENEMGSIYNWNEIPIEKKVRYLGIVSRNGEAVYHEIVLLNQDGEKLLPVNAKDYSLLFDEQESFPLNMTYYYRTMFDEVYYAGSAYEFLNGMKMFEDTHPPMGKILIALGVWLFGVTPFGWRFICAVLGVLMVPLMFIFINKLLKNEKAALFGTGLFCLDFMHYTLSRIATLDSIVAFFILMMFTGMLFLLEKAGKEIHTKRNHPSLTVVLLMLLCAVAVGMGVSVKWTGFYAMAGLAVLFWLFLIKEGRMIKREGGKFVYLRWFLLEGVMLFSIIPFLIYLASFIPQMLAVGSRNLFRVMWKSSLFMLNFHSDIVFEHPYSSPWFTWPWVKMPLVDSANFLADEKVSMVVTMGNPVIWIGGLVVFALMLYRVIRKRDEKAAFLCIAYLSMLVPWFFIKRTVFIYQYYGSSLFLYGMLGYVMTMGKKEKKKELLYFEAALFTFIMFFPIISGFSVSTYHVKIYLEWLRSWNFLP